jgi:hypothetical protein
MRRIVVSPPDGFRVFVVVANVAPNLAGQIRDRCEDAARDQVALDLGEPELDLIQPQGVRRREVQMDVRMPLLALSTANLYTAIMLRRPSDS